MYKSVLRVNPTYREITRPESSDQVIGWINIDIQIIGLSHIENADFKLQLD